MRISKKFLILSIIVLTCAIGGISYAYQDNKAHVPEPFRELTLQEREVQAGISYEEKEMPVRVDNIKALEIANSEYPGWMTQAQQKTLKHVIFSDAQIGINNRPAWLVTLTGLQLRSHGPAPTRFHTEANIVIDSSTGEILESYHLR